MTMDGSAVDRIAELARLSAQPVTIDGAIHTAVKMHDSRTPAPLPVALKVRRLSGLVTYVREVHGYDRAEAAIVALVVDDAGAVRAIGALQGHHDQRATYVVAECPDRMTGSPFAFGQFLGVETMIVALQALFEPTGDRDNVLAVLGNLRDEAVRNQEDDGVSQTVTARAGIATVQNVKVPNPVSLAPRRTFDEVKQPVSPFVLRMRKSDTGVQAALFEADGGQWQAEAMQSIAAYLSTQTLGLGLSVLA